MMKRSMIASTSLMMIVCGCGPVPPPAGDNGPGPQGTATTVAIESGGELVFPAGSLPAGTIVETAAAEMPVLPLGVTPVGAAVRIALDRQVSRPATLRLPVPPGVDAARVSIFQVDNDGTTTMLTTEVEGNRLVATTTHFTASPVGSGAGAFQLFDIGAIKAALGIRDTQSAIPELSPPRQGRIFGPRFLRPEQGMFFYLDGLDDVYTDALDTRWTLFGPAILSSEAGEMAEGDGFKELAGGRDMFVFAIDSGRIDLTVEYTDPGSGQRGLAAISVTVIDEPFNDLALVFVRGKAEVDVGEGTLFVVVAADAADGPVTYRWDFGDGGSDAVGSTVIQSGEGFPAHLPVYAYQQAGTYTLTVEAEDAGGRTGSAEVRVTAVSPALVVLIEGPLVTHRATSPFDTREFFIFMFGGTLPYILTWEVFPSDFRKTQMTSAISVTEQLILSEAGTYRLAATVRDSTEEEVIYARPLTVTGANPLDLFVQADALTAQPGQIITFSFEISGGVLIMNGRKEAYQLRFDWGDGQSNELRVDAATTRVVTTDSAVHSFSAAGTYTVRARLVDAAGAHMEQVLTIAVGGPPGPGDDPPGPAMATIQGATTASSGAPLAGIEVTALDEFGMVGGSAVSGTDGAFVISGLFEEAYLVTARAAGFAEVSRVSFAFLFGGTANFVMHPANSVCQSDLTEFEPVRGVPQGSTEPFAVRLGVASFSSGATTLYHPNAAATCLSGDPERPTIHWNTDWVGTATSLTVFDESLAIVFRLSGSQPLVPPIVYGRNSDGTPTDPPSPPLRADGTTYRISLGSQGSGNLVFLVRP